MQTRYDRGLLTHFDVILDDGLHVPLSNDATMSFLWPYLSRQDGLYIIEDLEHEMEIQARHWRGKFDQHHTPVLTVLQGISGSSNIAIFRKTLSSVHRYI